MRVSRRRISILIILHNVTIAQEDSGQRKTITRCNDSLGTLLFFPTALLQQHHVVALMVSNAGFFAMQISIRQTWQRLASTQPDLLGMGA